MNDVGDVERGLRGLRSSRIRAGVTALPRRHLVRQRLRIAVADLRTSVLRRRLAQLKRHQRASYETLEREAPVRYAEVRGCQPAALLTPAWVRIAQELERIVFSEASFKFLRSPTVLRTMFVATGGDHLRRQLGFLERRYSAAFLVDALEEDYVGDPPLLVPRYRTSHQAVHHLFHLARFELTTGKPVPTIEGPIIEWGGGYGSLAKIHRRIHGGKPTQIIVDLPILSILQWMYLGAVFGPGEVRLATPGDATIARGKITLVPLGIVDRVPAECELFVSTWALSESSPLAQDYVIRRRWFGARHLLLAYQVASPMFPAARRVGRAASQDGARIEPVGVIPRDEYAVR